MHCAFIEDSLGGKEEKFIIQMIHYKVLALYLYLTSQKHNSLDSSVSQLQFINTHEHIFIWNISSVPFL